MKVLHRLQFLDPPLMTTAKPPLTERRLALRLGVGAALSSLLVFGTPAHAAGGWTGANLTALAGAPAAIDSVVFGYTTSLTGQGPVARVVYRTAAGHIQELSVAGGGSWRSAQLTQIPDAADSPVGYTTTLTGQGPVARVVYRTTAGRIKELSVAGGGTWGSADLTQITGAPPAGSRPFGYVTSLTGQGPVARVVYRTTAGHIQELSVAGGGSWRSAQLTPVADASTDPSGYVTSLTGQGPVARVVYRTTAGRIKELSVAGGGSWNSADLTQVTGAPSATSPPSGYVTSLTGQGPVARVVYRTTAGHIQELSVAGDGRWRGAQLTPAADAAGAPFGYVTSLTGQGPVARVVYRTTAGRIKELSVAGGGTWGSADLTQITGAPGPCTCEPSGYVTSLTGQGPVARVIHIAGSGQIQELSVT